MILQARAVRMGRKLSYRCDNCKRPIKGPYIYLFGKHESIGKPWAMRLCGKCITKSIDPDPKLAAAIELWRAMQ